MLFYSLRWHEQHICCSFNEGKIYVSDNISHNPILNDALAVREDLDQCLTFSYQVFISITAPVVWAGQESDKIVQLYLDERTSLRLRAKEVAKD